MTPPPERGAAEATLPPFVGNDYRKQVLAPIVKRGGDPDGSDVFELYAVPLASAGQPDAVIAERLDEVWGFWQRHRDQPKYRILVAQLVAEHEGRSAPLRAYDQRQQLADQVRRQRGEREQTRFETLDLAIRRLVERYRGIPEDKVEGLCELAAHTHIGRDEAMRRLRRHRRVPAVGATSDATPSSTPSSTTPSATPSSNPSATPDSAVDGRARQVRDLLDELGRHAEGPPPNTLFDLLGLAPDVDPAQIGDRARMWRARSREMPPGRQRAVIDELLVHVQHLLERGPSARSGYLDAVAREVRDRLRPRMRAAILVEDALLPDDRHYLTDEAIALGLDHARAARVITELAAELTAPRRGEAPPATDVTPAWEQALRAARAALREGRCGQAKATVDRARAAARTDPAAAGPCRAAAGEIDEVVAAARLRWRAAVSAFDAGRYAEALVHLEHVQRTARDLPYPGDRRFDLDDLLARSRAAVAAADRAVADAADLAESDRAARLLEAVEICAEHPAAMEQLAAIPVGPPANITTVRTAAGVEVSWEPSTTPGVRYRVARIGPDGTEQVVGRTSATTIADGGVTPEAPVPVYVVTAQHIGRSSDPVRSDTAAPAGGPAAPAVPVAPPGVPSPEHLVVRPGHGSVVIEWDPVPGATYKVSRVEADGTERVVGRTSVPTIEDGGAPAGSVPIYEVIALRDGHASPSARSGT